MGSRFYNSYIDPRNYLRGGTSSFRAGMDAMLSSMQTAKRSKRIFRRYQLDKCRKTRAYKKSPVSQKSIMAPNSRMIDTKYVDQLNTFTGVKSAAALALIIGDLQGGSGEGQRVGNDIRMIKYIVTLQLKHGSESTDQTYRILYVRALTQNSNAVPSLADILNNDPTGLATPTSLRNINQLEDFEILLDKVLYLPNHTGATNHALKTWSWNIDCCFPQRFSGAGSGSIIRNPVYVYMVTNAANATTGASGNLTTRIIYSDII